MKNKLFGFWSILAIAPLIVASWILIHVLAVAGFFLAIAYPFWWFFAPKRTICLFCRVKKEGEWCPFCRHPVEKRGGNCPRSVASVVCNSCLIFLFSAVSAGVVWGESQLLFKIGFPPTPKTASLVIPDKGQYRLGEIFPMKIELVGMKVPINTIQTDFKFDPHRLELVEISTKNSFANIFIQKEINNEIGYARLTGGLPNPGYFSDRGVFGMAFFKGKVPGLVEIEFLPSSMILANDGRGTNVLKDLASASYLILPEKISPEEENLQKSISLNSTVLGENTDNTQLRFYDESKVLGAVTKKEMEKVEKKALFPTTMEYLEKVDATILSSWAKIFIWSR